MSEATGAYNHGRYKNNSDESLHTMFKYLHWEDYLKVHSNKHMDRQLECLFNQTQTITDIYICLLVTLITDTKLQTRIKVTLGG